MHLFFSAITEQNLFSPSKTYTLDGASFPIKGGMFYNEYKEFLNSIITRNNIEKIYFIKNEKIEEKVIKNYINSNCYDIYEEKYFKYFLIKKECFN